MEHQEVFVVLNRSAYGIGVILGIFSSNELAEKYIRENYRERQNETGSIFTVCYLIDGKIRKENNLR